MTTKVETGRAAAPRLFYEERGPVALNWIAEATDGRLYLVPSVPGGWLQREAYMGDISNLKAVSEQKALTLAWYVYGDVGQIRIAGTEQGPFQPVMSGEDLSV